MERKYEAEIMDDFSIRDERIDDALRELKMINIVLGGKETTRDGFRSLRKKKSLPDRLTVLDVGAGGADVFDDRNGFYSVTALDKNPRTCLYLKNNSHHQVICGDALEMPFQERSFDVIHVSLFLHHFTEDQIVRLLLSFSTVARHGVIINDLRRSMPAMVGIKILTSLFSRSEMVKHDGPLSVQRGFIKRDLLQILDKCAFNHFTIKRKWAFRWLVVIEI